MLYEFHRKQNAKKPGSIHATYLLTGIQKAQHGSQSQVEQSRDIQDVVMQSSPPIPGSSAPEINESPTDNPPVRLMLVAKEEDLEKARERFETISGIHVYSLEHTTPSDMQALTECNRKIAVDYASEDPLAVWKQYGTIHNPQVKRRTRRVQPPPPAAIPTTAAAKNKVLPPTTKPTISEKQASVAKAKDSSKEEPAKPALEAEKSMPPSKRTATSKPATLKKQDSNIFKSFAKGKPKLKESETASSKEASPAAQPEDGTCVDYLVTCNITDGTQSRCKACQPTRQMMLVSRMMTRSRHPLESRRNSDKKSWRL